MRHLTSVTFVVLAACGNDATDDAPNETDTDHAPDVCLDPLSAAPFPAAWAAQRDNDLSCRHTWTCSPSSTAAFAVGRSQCEGSVVGFYDADGALVGATENNDTETCRDGAFETHFGTVVEACDWPAEASRAPGCAQPVASTVQLTDGPAPDDSRSWTSVLRELDRTCLGRLDCEIREGHTVSVIYNRDSCDTDTFTVWHETDGYLGGTDTTDASGPVALPTLTDDERDALSVCLREPFTPSAGCKELTPDTLP